MSFADLGLVPELLQALEHLELTEPTPVQRMAVPALLGGRSVFVVARTGSGKTLAYGLPLLQLLSQTETLDGMVEERARPRALVLTSTRELVDQTAKVLKSLSHFLRARIRGLSGGMLPSEMNKRLAEPVDVIVGNPTRIATLVREKKLDLSDLRMLVVDEADTLLSPGQYIDLKMLLDQPGNFPRCYVSATLPEPMRQLVVNRPEKPVVLLSKDAHSAPDRVKIQNLQVKAEERLDSAHDLLQELPKAQRGIIFANRRETAAEVAKQLTERGHTLEVIHGAMLPNERRIAMKAFRDGKGRFLVTTELGGRGLHIDDLAWVMNYELPERPSEYLHRIGRVGRAGGSGGRVINLIGPGDSAMAAEIKRLATGARLDTGETLRGVRKRELGAARKAAQATRKPPVQKTEEKPERGEVQAPGGRRGRSLPKNPGRGKKR